MNLEQKSVRQTCMVVLGMHRSGTSALTGVLSLLGIHPGDALLPAMQDVNPKGFWEHAEIVSIHDQLLKILGSSWDDESPLPDKWWLSPLVTPFRNKIVNVLHRDFGELRIWLLKDPRMCRLLPLWQDVLHELGCEPLYVIALRHPSEVARSLRERNDLEEVASCLLWLTHMLEAEYQTRGQPRTFVQYERLLSDWRETVAEIGQTLGLTWPVAPVDAAAGIEAFLDASLRHHVDNTLPDHPVCGLAKTVFDLLSSGAASSAELDHLRAQTEDVVRLVTPWSRRLHRVEQQSERLRANVAHLNIENAVLHAEIKRVKSTMSWQITKPLRLVANMSRMLFDQGRRKPNSPDIPSTPGNSDEQEARILLLEHFSPVYKNRVSDYIDGLFAIDHYRHRFEYLRSVIGFERFHPEAQVLISGYGAGSEMIAARQAGLGDIYGTEVEYIWLEATRMRLALMPNMYPSHYDGTLLPYPDDKFDIVVSGHVIEHTHDPQSYLHECMRVLAAGGYLSLEFPNRYHHTELHTLLPSLEWLPRTLRNAAIRTLSARFSPLNARVKAQYRSLVTTRLHQISVGSVRNWLTSSSYPHTILNITKAVPGVVRCVVRKDGDVSTTPVGDTPVISE